MRYGFIIPGGDVQSIPDLTAEAEEAGWDGVFIPDCISIETSLKARRPAPTPRRPPPSCARGKKPGPPGGSNPCGAIA